jgi:hypothetical protein
MTTQNYLVVEENTVNNLVLWDGNVNTWQPPAGAIMLVADTTPAMIWGFNADKTDVILVEVMGAGQIGFTWNGTVVTTNEPKPAIPATA